MGDTAKYALKIAIIIGLTITFATSVFTLLSMLTYATVGTHFGEIITLINLYLPFNANAVFTSFTAVMTAVLSFLVARKIYDMLMENQKSAS